MQKTQSIFGLVAAAAVGITLMASEVTADTLPPLLVFGDSLSDGGAFGNFFSFVGANDQFTDTNVWATQLGVDFASGRNFAEGGATYATSGTNDPTNAPDIFAPRSFSQQIAVFAQSAAAGTVTPETWAVVWFGGNDLRAAVEEPNPAAAAAAAIETSMVELATGVTALATARITNFLVPGLPNLGLVPSLFGTAAAPAATLASTGFNAQLQATVASIDSNPFITAQYLDIDGLFTEIVADAAANGFTKPTTEACVDTLFIAAGRECTGFLFADGIHPTGAAHAIIADAVSNAIAPVPLPAGMWLLLSGAGAFGAMRLQARRRAVA